MGAVRQVGDTCRRAGAAWTRGDRGRVDSGAGDGGAKAGGVTVSARRNEFTLRSQSEYGVKRRLDCVWAGARHGGGDVSQTSQTVFVLEDDPDINRLVGHQLERAGYAVRPYFVIGSIVEDAERAR